MTTTATNLSPKLTSLVNVWWHAYQRDQYTSMSGQVGSVESDQDAVVAAEHELLKFAGFSADAYKERQLWKAGKEFLDHLKAGAPLQDALVAGQRQAWRHLEGWEGGNDTAV